jgi:hypothetical protein
MDTGIGDTLKRAGWRASDRYKRFLHTRRAGIDFHLGPLGAGNDAARLELRYRYQTEVTNAEGTVDLPADVSAERVGDAMTAVYQRVHERPDPSRVFGLPASRVRRGAVPAPRAGNASGAEAAAPGESPASQLDLIFDDTT